MALKVCYGYTVHRTDPPEGQCFTESTSRYFAEFIFRFRLLLNPYAIRIRTKIFRTKCLSGSETLPEGFHFNAPKSVGKFECIRGTLVDFMTVTLGTVLCHEVGRYI